ncbi:F-box/kelch-repeat protein [Trifolium repens]|nr:F-box/kelch-repeat protein [Trifolium repens]
MEEGGTKRRRLVVRLRLPRKAATLPKELLVEIFSWLPVKHVVQLRCLNKFFKTLIFDPYFVDLHLNKSQQQQQLAITYGKLKDNTSRMETLSIPRLLRNKSPIFHQNTDPDRLLNGYSRVQLQRVVASCNGLVCLFSVSYPSLDQWICFWNPAIRTKSIKFPVFFSHNSNYYVSFSFGYDNSTRTYKLVVFYMEMDFEPGSLLLKVFSFGGDDDDNSCWRDIQCSFPVLPLFWHHDNIKTIDNKGAHLNGTINWIVLRDYKINTTVVSVDQYVILSLDLSTEKCTQLLLPQRFDDKEPWHPPKLVVLLDSLCFCHDIEETHFVIWQMKNFGVQDSWVQLFQISYEDSFFTWMNLWPLYLSHNHDTLILANYECHDHEAFIYNHKYNQVDKIGNNKVDEIGITGDIHWLEANNYVESLVSTH